MAKRKSSIEQKIEMFLTNDELGRENLRLKARIRELEAELAVRTSYCFNNPLPEQFRRSPLSGIYASGYECGWRGKTFKQVYTRYDYERAFGAGWQEGARDSAAAIAAKLAEADRIDRAGGAKEGA